jgi:chemotaxis protein methyltransferase CheR
MDTLTQSRTTPPTTGAQSRLRRQDFARLATFIEDYAGIKMPPSKSTLLEGRLQRRVRALGMADLAKYCHFLFEENGLASETVHLIDAVSTNKTDFFREPEQFRVLQDKLLPELVGRKRQSPTAKIDVWSSACSTGAEPYTLAMVLSEFAKNHRNVLAGILATDINSAVLETARQAIYPEEVVEPIAPAMRKLYILRSRDRSRQLIRIVPELRAMVRFGRLNLMAESYDVDAMFDFIFCRNVLIYFHRNTQADVLLRLCKHLRPGGHLFLGHSESITGLDLPLRPLGNNVFLREPS